jgi:hypothetical protein
MYFIIFFLNYYIIWPDIPENTPRNLSDPDPDPDPDPDLLPSPDPGLLLSLPP